MNNPYYWVQPPDGQLRWAACRYTMIMISSGESNDGSWYILRECDWFAYSVHAMKCIARFRPSAAMEFYCVRKAPFYSRIRLLPWRVIE